MSWSDWLDKYDLGFDKNKYEIEDGLCPKCGGNLVVEFKFLFCSNTKCNYQKVLKGEVYEIDGVL